ncbi:MAG: alpha/beta hydrolase [Chloroflexota bacterium]
MADYDSYRVLAGKVRLHIADWTGDGTPVLFIHSFTANALAALPLGNLLQNRRRLIAPDLRGRGTSDTPFGEYGIQVHAKDMIALLDRLEIDKVVAGGHSFGAAISLYMAAFYPDRVTGLILFDGGAMPSKTAQTFLDSYYNSLQYRYPTLEAYVDRYRTAPLYQPWTAELETLVRSNLIQQPDGTYIRRVPRYVVETDRQAEYLENGQQFPDLYNKVNCPVLIVRAEMGIRGAEDQVLSDDVLATMLQGMPAAQTVTITGAGHTSLLTIPSPVRDSAILKFLDMLH